MYLIFPFIYYSGLTGWNGYLYFHRNGLDFRVDGNPVSYDISFSYEDMEILFESSPYGRSLDLRFGYSRIYYLSDSSIYVFALGKENRYYSLFVGVSSLRRPAIFFRASGGFQFFDVIKFYPSLTFRTIGGFYTPFRREEAWGFDRNQLRDDYVLSATLLSHLRLWRRVIYAGIVPVGQKGMDLVFGFQISKMHRAYAVGLKIYYPVVGSFSILVAYNPTGKVWDVFAGVGSFQF